MKVLLDHNVPRPIRRLLVGHEVATARENAWDELINGELLRAAAAANFDFLLTLDRSPR